MAAPVHRFATLDPPARRYRPRHTYIPPPPIQSIIHARRRTPEDTLVMEMPEPPPARPLTPDTLVRTAALGLHTAPVIAPHLKCGMLASFVLASVFIAGAKYYFDEQRPYRESGEAGALCLAVAAVFGLGCVLTAMTKRTQTMPPQLNVQQTPQASPPPTATSVQPPGPATSVPPPASPPPPPPPYHIAVLLPTRQNLAEMEPAPPAYSAISR